MGQLVWLLSICSGLLALLTCVGLLLTGRPIQHLFVSWGPVGITVFFDKISAVMILLVSFIAISVISFSRNYLGGNPSQGCFFKWLSVTAGSVLFLVISGNLLLFALAWAAVSLSLHKLLAFYTDRQGAQLAARKKFVFSRLGDMALLGACWITWREFGLFDYVRLFFMASKASPHSIHLIALLLVVAAMIKSAQFPFHGWLPDTMETPTPVSALMHAGIINAGGFLIIRLSPLMALSTGALELLAIVGGFTAFFGSMVMITQSSVKRSLAFSTVAQMGFMMLQCGLGAFALALLHIVAHSLYKAHAFLSSGNMMKKGPQSGVIKKQHLGFASVIASFAIAFGLVFLIGLLLGIHFWRDSGECALALILGIALAQMLWLSWSVAPKSIGFFGGLFIGSLLCIFSFLLHAGAEFLVGQNVAPVPALIMAWPIAIVSVLAFFLLALRAFLPPSWYSTHIARVLFVHAYNGFYVGTIVNRLISSMWPLSKTPVIHTYENYSTR